jgi:hypothetical protein
MNYLSELALNSHPPALSLQVPRITDMSPGTQLGVCLKTKLRQILVLDFF